MPQLMPLSWMFSAFMLSFMFFMLIKMYYMESYHISIIDKGFLNNKFIWVW